MSVKAMTWVFESSKATLGPRLVMLAIADFADDRGENAFPSVDTLAKKAVLSKRATQYALRKLEEELHEIEPIGKSQFGTTNWRIVGMSKGANLAPAESAPPGGADSARNRSQIAPDPSENGSGSTANAVEPEPVRSAAKAAERTPQGEGNAESTTASSAPNDKPSATERERDPEYVRLSKLLADLIATNRDGRRPKQSAVEKWPRHIRRMVELDDLTAGVEAQRAKRKEPPLSPAERRAKAIEIVERAIRWSQNDPFWQINVLSTAALRKHYDQLEAAARKERKPASARRPAPSADRDWVDHPELGRIDRATARRLEDAA